jgi:ABC-type transport system involved in cytochrome c biogenesis permease subunit
MSGHGAPPSVSMKTVGKLITSLIAVCVLLVGLDFTYTKHGHYDFEQIPGFHAAFGFVSFVLLVLTATQLRKIVMRSEDYYDD